MTSLIAQMQAALERVLQAPPQSEERQEAEEDFALLLRKVMTQQIRERRGHDE